MTEESAEDLAIKLEKQHISTTLIQTMLQIEDGMSKLQDGKDDDDEDEVDDDGDDGQGQDDTAGGKSKRKRSRAEKKTRKAMQNLGMEPVTDVTRVTFKRSKDIQYVISKPDVFKCPGSDSFIIFGEVKMQDLRSELQNIKDLSSQFQNVAAELLKDIAEADAATPSASIEEDDDGEDVDEDVDVKDVDGVEPEDIELVITQTGVSRGKAVKALKASDGDIVDAIMALQAD